MRTDEPTISAALAKVPAQPNQKGAEAAIKQALPDFSVRQVKAIASLVRVPAETVVTDVNGQPEADPDLRENENAPLPAITVQWETEVTDRLATVEYHNSANEYLAAEVHPYAPDAWIDYDKTKIGYEIPLTRHFYKNVPSRPLAKIDAEIKQLETEIQALLHEVAE